ncbi:MFS transporter [Bradyrhizobium sp. LVM 105]|uniref:MFS transporter n=1 Tax=Bradyrhizobium sp. LVM 105 TaxID=2341115 RepID=UPI000F8073E3|nr:MFS transporter [Bradyrhizobium sp. LVM 105]RTE91290.1 MFS transporter [Bradyrhizobium sp. LVM 105]
MTDQASVSQLHLASATIDRTQDRPVFRKFIAAATVGNIFEWYDWGVFAFVVTYIARNFFPSQDPTAALLSTFATFGAGFVARPVGALLIGWVGDKYGRKSALMVTIYVMAIGTVGTAFIPTFSTIGIWAPVLLVCARLLQGISTGGELGGSLAFIVEWAPRGQRGFYGSFQQASTLVGLLIGSGVAAILNSVLTPDQMLDWGWRIPFAIGGVLLPIGIWMRRDLEDTPIFRESKHLKSEPTPVKSASIMVLRAVGFGICWTTCQYLILSYMATFTAKQGGLTETQSLWSHTTGIIFAIVFTPIWGMLSDRIGRRPLLIAVNLFFAVMGYAIFWFIASAPGLVWIVLAQCALGIIASIHTGVGPAAITEIFPTKSRSFLNSLAFALVVSIFGGFSPYIATWLIHTTGSPISPSYLLIVNGLIATVTVALSKETAHEELS